MRFIVQLILFGAFLTLHAQSPFKWHSQVDKNLLTVTLSVADNSYIDAKSVDFQFKGGVKKISAPTPVKESFPSGVWVWQFKVTSPFSAEVSFQGCVGKLCLVPETITLWSTEKKLDTYQINDWSKIQISGKSFGMISPPEMIKFLDGTNSTAIEKTDQSAGYKNLGWLMIIILTLLGGLGLNLTPCVLPMIPVNLAIIGVNESRRAGLVRGSAYGIGMAGAYGVVGAFAVATGAKFGQLNSSSYFNYGIAIIFILLSLAMFGVFNVDLSRFMRVKPSKIKGGKIVVALVMGAVAALLAGACVAPVVIAVLVFASERYASGNYGAILLPLVLGVGMALPWPLAGWGLSVLPKPGKFMIIIKYVFGIIIMIAAIYYGYSAWQMQSGQYDIKQEMEKLHQGLAQGKREGKIVVVDFWASWCKNCLQLEKETMQNPQVQEELKKYVVVKFQCEHPNQSPAKELLDAWKIPGFPAIIKITP